MPVQAQSACLFFSLYSHSCRVRIKFQLPVAATRGSLIQCSVIYCSNQMLHWLTNTCFQDMTYLWPFWQHLFFLKPENMLSLTGTKMGFIATPLTKDKGPCKLFPRPSKPEGRSKGQELMVSLRRSLGRGHVDLPHPQFTLK